MDTLISTQKMVPLASHTTLAIGGPAGQFVRIESADQAADVISWWRGFPEAHRPALLPLGGGSNLLVADSGFDGLVMKMENRDFDILEENESTVVVRVGAGWNWDEFVAATVSKGWAGVECLSGIPGCVGASPVQNIGAYGQEVSETVHQVEGLDTSTGEKFVFLAEDCDFSYRDSFFKKALQGRYLITFVTFCLRPGGEPTIRYQDLKRRLEELPNRSLQAVRNLVLDIRRSKSMVYDKDDPNHRSAGSFFTNPLVEPKLADQIESSLPHGTKFPRFPHGPDKVKLSAAWLIDHAGLKKGFRLPGIANVGLSTRHVLALTNRGGGSAEELLQLCRHVQNVVETKFGVRLEPEPVFVGF